VSENESIVPVTEAPSGVPLPHRILLVTFDWSTLTEMPYLVKQSGCTVDVLCPAANMVTQWGFYDRRINAGDSMQSLLAALVPLAQDPAYRCIMIGDDPILWAIYRHRLAALWHLLPVKNVAALPVLNKVGFAEHCEQHGIPSPAFAVVRCAADVGAAIEKLGMPLVLKQNYSNGPKVSRCASTRPLARLRWHGMTSVSPCWRSALSRGDMWRWRRCLKMAVCCSTSALMCWRTTTARRPNGVTF
jgi:hypothetical protein